MPDATNPSGAQEHLTDADAGGDVGGEMEGTGFGRRSKSLVNPETIKYLEEIVAHFKTLVDDEERALLVGNVLEEVSGKEVKVAGDPVCSRHIETLMAVAQAAQLLKFLTSVSDVDGFFTLVSSPFGSHVVEKLLVRLEAQLDVMSDDEYAEFERVMTVLTDSICPHLYDYVTDRFATHVVRRFLCLLVGWNVLPPPGKQQQQQQNLPGLENKRSKGEPARGLAAKLGPGASNSAGGATTGRGAAAALAADLLGLSDEPPPCRMPDLVSRFTSVICGEDYVGATVSELVYHPYACPFLQALLRAAASDMKALRQLVPVLLGATTFNDSAKSSAVAVLEGCRDEEVAAMLMDSTTSHLVEVLLQVQPRPLLEEFIKRFIAPRLAELAHHPSANFVVQSALAATPSKEMATIMYDGLVSLLPDLLRKRRSGVVAALVACCGRHGVCQREVCVALAAALGGQPQWANQKGDAALAPALLCLDTVPVVGANEPFSAASITSARGGGNSLPRLSPVGCSILIQVLRYGQGACRSFTDSVAALQPYDAARVGADPSGSRVIEALLEGNAPPKVKGLLLGSLAGHWDAVASTGSGSFLVETAYRNGDMAVKEAIVSRLASAVKALEVTHWGPTLMRKVGVEAFNRDPEQWRRHANSATKTLDEFAKIFGGASVGGDEAKGKSQKSRKAGKVADDVRDGGQGGKSGVVGKGGQAAEEAVGGSAREERKRKKRKAEVAAIGHEGPSDGTGAQQDGKVAEDGQDVTGAERKKKKSKGKKEERRDEKGGEDEGAQLVGGGEKDDGEAGEAADVVGNEGPQRVKKQPGGSKVRRQSGGDVEVGDEGKAKAKRKKVEA